MIFKLTRNEFRKLIRRPKTWIVCALFALFIGLTIFATYNSDKDMRYYMSPEYQLENSKSSLEYYNSEIDRINKMSDKEKELYKSDLLMYQEQKQYEEENIKKYEEIIKSGKDTSWEESLDENIKYAKDEIARIEEVGVNEDNQSWYLQAKQDLEYYSYLKTNNIEPLYGWEFEAYGYMKTLIMFLGMAILAAGIAVFMSDIVSGECTPATLKFLLVQPVKRGQVLISKFIASTATTLGLILGMEGIGFLIVKLFSKINGNDYPVIMGKLYESKINAEGQLQLLPIEGSGQMVTNSELLIKAILLQGLFIITICAVVFLISSIIKSSMVTMGVSVIALVFTTIMGNVLDPLKKVAHLVFLNFGNTIQLLTGDLAISFNNANMTVQNGIIVMIITTVISYIIAHIVFTKKDILI